MDTIFGQSSSGELRTTETCHSELPSRITIPPHWTSSGVEGAGLPSDLMGIETEEGRLQSNKDEYLVFRTTSQQQHNMAADHQSDHHRHQHQQQQQILRRGNHTVIASETVMGMPSNPAMSSTPQHLNSPSWQPTSITANDLRLPLSPTSSGGYMPETRLETEHVGALAGVYAYCFDRGNGNYTRLIPADMLPPLLGIPALQQSSGGLMILPLPSAEPPRGPSSNVQPVMLKTPPPSPGPVPDTIQKTIDNIVACSPGPPKRTKVYCDKWVHEGVCAFTQQGCKYKHEMPQDKATQHSLGLFHGFPTWWKKHQAELQRHKLSQGVLGGDISLGTSPSVVGAVAEGGNGRGIRTSAPRAQQATAWRRQDATRPAPLALREITHVTSSGSQSYRAGPAARGGSDSFTPYRQNSSPTSPCVWGPIGPPSRFPSMEDSPTSYAPFVSGGIGAAGRGSGNHVTANSLEGNMPLEGRDNTSEGEQQRLERDQLYYEQQLARLDGLRMDR